MIHTLEKDLTASVFFYFRVGPSLLCFCSGFFLMTPLSPTKYRLLSSPYSRLHKRELGRQEERYLLSFLPFFVSGYSDYTTVFRVSLQLAGG